MSFLPTHPDAPNIYPVLRYRDGNQAATFLEGAFGFERHAFYTDDAGSLVHGELRLGAGMIMLGTAKPDSEIEPQAIYIAIGNVDEHYARAKAFGAEIIGEPNDTDYGSREYAAKDCEGHSWSFGTYQPAAGEP